MWEAFAGLGSVLILGVFTSLAVHDVAGQSDLSPVSHPNSNCYARAVYDELIKAIDMINAQSKKTAKLNHHSNLPLQKKLLQDDEDYPTDFAEGIPPILPMIFQILGNTLSLNSSGVSESTFGIIPERVSNQITSVLGSLANRILGTPTTTPSPPKRRRRTTTPAPSEDEMETNGTSELPSSNITMTDMDSLVIEARMNETETEEPYSSTSEMLFHESSLGELPVYAAAYAPNYVATTPYPVYASNFLHVLYPAPTTTTTTTTSTTTVDPNSYSVSLPFDYQEVTTVAPSNFTAAVTEEDDYDYEEFTEDTRGNKIRKGTTESEPESKS